MSSTPFASVRFGASGKPGALTQKTQKCVLSALAIGAAGG